MPTLILASSSEPRRWLLARLQIPFEVIPSHIDETPLANEKPGDMVLRLAREKAEAVAAPFKDALIIGVDQVGVCDDVALGKPMTQEKAVKQLQFTRGKWMRYHIGLCLLNTKDNTKQMTLETFDVLMRPLSDTQILNYLAKEDALQCAGSLKAEGLGIACIEKFQGDDIHALIGLPLIKLTTLLANAGLSVL